MIISENRNEAFLFQSHKIILLEEKPTAPLRHQHLEKKSISPVQESAEDVFGKMIAFGLKQNSRTYENASQVNKTIYNSQMLAKSAPPPLVTIQAPIQTHVHNTLLLPSLSFSQPQEQTPLQAPCPRYPTPMWYNNSDFNTSS